MSADASAGVAERFRTARDDPGLAVLEGFHAVKHALRFGAELLEVVTPDPGEALELARALAPDVEDRLEADLRVVDPSTFDRLTAPRPPGPVAALARRPHVDARTLVARPGPRPVVLLDAPRNLGNLGAAVRAAAAAEADAVLTTGTADPWHPAAIRGAAGLQFALPVARLPSASDIRCPLVAVVPDADELSPARVPAGAVLAFGSERHGLGDEILRLATARVALPMRPGVSSLNLATAVAATLYVLRLGPTRPAR